MTDTVPTIRPQVVTDAVRAGARGARKVTLMTLIGSGDNILAVWETLPADVTPDTVAGMLAALARMMRRHPDMYPPNVAGYAVALPAETVAFARDRSGAGYSIPLPGKPVELRSDRWGAIKDGLTAMIEALP
jgi:hypothetical protein